MSNITDSKRIDDTSRNLIISPKGLKKNLFVIAGAGSGKTSMLVSRMVAMVESGIDVSKICAITFTKKAAAEFLERFHKKLKERSTKPFSIGNNFSGDLPTPTEETAAYCQKALKDIDLCFTGTIDSFCNLVLSEYPNDAGIPSSSQVIDDDEFINLCKKEYKAIANDPNHPLKDKFAVFNQLFKNGAEVFAKSIKDVMDYSHLTIVRPSIDKSLLNAFKELANEYEKDIQNDLNTILLKKNELVDDSRVKNVFTIFEQNYKKMVQPWTLENFITIKQTIKRVFKKDSDSNKSGDFLRFNLNPTLKLFEFVPVSKVFKFNTEFPQLKDYFNKVDKIIYTYAMDFLCSVANYIRWQLKKQGKLSFNEYLITFRDMVVQDMRKQGHLIKHIRSKHKYFLLDESQDTSPIQTELFIYLCSQVTANSLKDCVPEPGSLFIVGDPKQSIYGFRGADVNAYLNTKALFESVYDQNDNQVIYLTKNFRSSLELCEYFNERFEKLDNYEPIPTDPDCILVPDKTIQKDLLSGLYNSSSEVSTIQSLVGKHYIFDKEYLKVNPSSSGKRLITYKDIMLLTWSTSKHDTLLKELKANHIPVFCEGKFYIYGAEIVEVIYAICSYLADEPGSFINLLCSPLFNANLDNLTSIKSVDDLPDCPEKQLLLEIEELKSINNPIILFNSVLEELKLFNYVDSMNVEYVCFAFEKLKDAYSGGLISDVKSASLFLRDFVSTKLERCMNFDNSPNAVFLANVHKVKGLERPIVILVESSFANKESTKYSDYSSNKGFIFKTSETDLGYSKVYDISSGDLFESDMAEADRKKDEENDRLGYVAVTRARNVLVIPSAKKANSVWNSIRLADALDNIPCVEGGNQNIEYVSSFNYEKPASFNQQATYCEMSPSKQAHLSSNYDSNQVIDISINKDNQESTDNGTLVHKLMQVLVNSKGNISKDSLIKNVLNEFSLDDELHKKLLERVYYTMTNGGYPQKFGAPQDLLSEIKDCECQCETPYSFKKGNEIWQGEIDLYYVKDGKYYIIDYKTNSNDKDLDKVYSNQLNAYKEAIKKALNVEAEARIYHIDIK